MDYELFFGKPAGSAEKCILEPTNLLIELAQKHKIGITYFVDVGYLIQLEKQMNDFPELKQTYLEVTGQLKNLLSKGNDVQLHIHPHWEKSYYDGKEWVMIVDECYKLTDFSGEEITEIVSRYKKKLENIIDRKVNAFRAGGWCLQPFSKVKTALKNAGIRYDSSVFQGGYFKTEHYYFDFRNAPMKGCYNFEDDLCEEEEQGSFTEYPIGGWKYNPLFYWRLYIKGRLRPDLHKMIGDGMFIPQPGRKYKNLVSSNWNHVSCDGYFASKLTKITNYYSKKERSDLVIIGHPKGMTKYSLLKIDEFIGQAKKEHNFKTFNDLSG